MNIIIATGLKKRKRVIFEQAQILFKERGYKATTMRDLADKVGIKASSLYSHIKSKEEILEFIIAKISKAFFDVQRVNQELSKDLKADEKLQNAIKSHMFIISENLNACSVYFNEWKNLNPTKLIEFKTNIKNYEKIFVDIVKGGINDWIFKQVDETFFVKTLLTNLNGISYSMHNENIDFEKVGENISNLFLNGIRQ